MFASGEYTELTSVIKEENLHPTDERTEHAVFSMYSVHKEHNYALTTAHTLKINHDLMGDDPISECKIQLEDDEDILGNDSQPECKVNAETVLDDSENDIQSKDNRVSVPINHPATIPNRNIHASADFNAILMKNQFHFANPPQESVVRIGADNKDKIIEIENMHFKLDNLIILSCNICKARFLTSEELETHKRAHRDVDLKRIPYKCDTCDHTCSTIEKIESHQDMHRSMKKPCQEVGADKKGGKTEVDNKTLNLNNCNTHVYSCYRCEAKFSTWDELKVHVLIHKDGTYKCDKCEYTCRTKQKLKSHQGVHRSLFYKCEVCGEIIKMLRNLKRHIKVKHNIKPESTYPEVKDNCTGTSYKNSYPCVVCAQEFNSKQLLAKHMQAHKRTCPKCQRSFRTNRNLKQHMLSHFDEDHPQEIKCNKCKIDFTDIESLNNHRSLSHPFDTVADLKHFACDLCQKVYPSEYHLKTHQYWHEYNRKPKRFACTLCDKVYDRKYKLEAHELAHLGQKPFLCEKCGSTFMQKKNLDHHMLLHENRMKISQGETTLNSGSVKRGLQCPKCGKIVSSKSILRSHENMVHTHRDAACCEICGELLCSTRALTLHIQRRHRHEYAFPCTICDKKFKTTDNLRTHVRGVHTTPLDIKRQRNRARYGRQIQRMIKKADQAKAKNCMLMEIKKKT